MLLEFKAKNYKLFKDEICFSMIAAQKQKGLDYSVFKEPMENNILKVLPTSVIYGINSGGKTSIISAMEVFKNIILRGNIKNNTQNDSRNIVINNLELIPNKDTLENNLVCFCIKFIEKKHMFEYKVSLDLGTFATRNYERKIVKEEFVFDSDTVFIRDEKTINFYKFNNIEKYLVKEFKGSEDELKRIAKNNINKEELFLVNGFKTMFSQDLVTIITNWLTNKFNPIFMSDRLIYSPIYDKEKTKFFGNNLINTIANKMGSTNKIMYYANTKDSMPEMTSIVENVKAIIPSIAFESYGTFRFLNIFPIIYKTLSEGGTLIVDEFDTSLHPKILMNIINIFHNDDININKAQLIFNTHNPIFLNSNLFRRDEIKFVERDEQTHFSELYSLSDFGTDGKDGVRKGEDYMKNYFVNKYGAIKDIDFSPIFEKLLGVKSE